MGERARNRARAHGPALWSPIPLEARFLALCATLPSVIIRGFRDIGTAAGDRLRMPCGDVGGPGILSPEAKRVRDPGQVRKDTAA